MFWDPGVWHSKREFQGISPGEEHAGKARFLLVKPRVQTCNFETCVKCPCAMQWHRARLHFISIHKRALVYSKFAQISHNRNASGTVKAQQHP